MSAQEGLRLFNRPSDLYKTPINTTDHEFGVQTSLVNLLNDDSLPLSRLEKFLQDILVPNNCVALDEVDLAEFCLNLGETCFIEFIDNNCVKILEALCERVKFSLETDAFVNEGG
jgi:hypothetical protein